MQASLIAGRRCCLQHLERVKRARLRYGKVRAAVAILTQSDKCEGESKDPHATEILTDTGARIGLVSWVVRK